MCASLLIASEASDMQVAHRMGHSKIDTIKSIYGHLFASDRDEILGREEPGRQPPVCLREARR